MSIKQELALFLEGTAAELLHGQHQDTRDGLDGSLGQGALDLASFALQESIMHMCNNVIASRGEELRRLTPPSLYAEVTRFMQAGKGDDLRGLRQHLTLVFGKAQLQQLGDYKVVHKYAATAALQLQSMKGARPS